VSGAWTYQGTSQAATVAISPNTKVAVTFDGQSILKGSDATDVLSLLDSLATAAQANDTTTLQAGQGLLKNAFARVTRAQSQVGYDELSVSDGEEQRSSRRLSATTRLAEDREVNMAEALTRMSRAQTAYQAALGAMAAISKQSLMDYIR
jgi:flagellin-like hook-associated protein FlgL